MSYLRELARVTYREAAGAEVDGAGCIVVAFDLEALAHGVPVEACALGPGAFPPHAIAALLRAVAEEMDPECAGRVRVRPAPFDEDDLPAGFLGPVS